MNRNGILDLPSDPAVQHQRLSEILRACAGNPNQAPLVALIARQVNTPPKPAQEPAPLPAPGLNAA